MDSGTNRTPVTRVSVSGYVGGSLWDGDFLTKQLVESDNVEVVSLPDWDIARSQVIIRHFQ